MFKLIDRLLIRSYVKSYIFCLVSLLGLYIVVDLFMNLDEFMQSRSDLGATLRHIGMYYSRQVTFIFDRLSEAIVLLAAMFTVAWVQRNNELLPLLSAGISTRRVVRPVLISACALVCVNIANQELLIPALGTVPIAKDDPNHEKPTYVNGEYDSNGVLITGRSAVRKDLLIQDFTCTVPPTLANGKLLHLHSREAFYVPPGDTPQTGGWRMTQTEHPEHEEWTRLNLLEQIDTGTYFLYTTRVNFDRLTQDKVKWFYQRSTWDLFQELLKEDDSNQLANIAVFFHTRLTRPLLGMILVIMGLGTILRNQNRHVFISAGFCLVLCAVFYGVGLGARYLGDHEILSPVQAAWLPVFLFGPVAFVLFDAIHT
jgi:lipopolysaccharide export system permease protein